MTALEDNSSLTSLPARVPPPGSCPEPAAATKAPDPPADAGRTAAPAAPATTAACASPSATPLPRPSQGLRLLGEYQGSGFTERRYIVRRGDGQVIQLSRLLYLVVAAVDGVRDAEAISHRVSGRYGAEVSTENIVHLVEHKLTPLGITLPFDGDPQEVSAPRSDLLLALRGHKVIFHETQVARIAAALAWVHHPLVVALVLAGAVAMDVWLFAVHGAITPVLQVLEQPLWMLILFALTVASLLFHEFGHASACRYSGAVPGKIGCGIFLIWPSMYTDVTDVYRIGRTGRLRTGLGGVYFNVVFMLALTAGYLLTGQPFFLAAIYLAHFEVLEQLFPVVRLDGYYILGDMAGVPDLYGKVKPILLSMLPGRPAAAEVACLKRSARTVVTLWVLTMVPLLLAEAAYVLWNLPRLLTTAVRGLYGQCLGTYTAFTDGHIAAGLVAVIGTLMLLCPLAGGAYLAGRLTARLWRAAARASRGRPVVRLSLAGAVAAACAVLVTAWVQGLTPRPLPEAAPVTPALQPGRPTPPAPHPSPADPAPGTVPGQGRLAEGHHPVATGRPTPTTPPPTASRPAQVPGTGTPSPAAEPTGPPLTTEAGPTPTSPPSDPSPSQSRSASASPSTSPSSTPTDSSPPSQPPPTSPPPPPSATGPSFPIQS
ncbi:hypothetical protein ABZ484_07215 [Streptomyces sp. NPDC006393]|uniref:hypothetical protein n=1 Tax=Streptomyces sp. NPDC006393 TaxID=3156763 RepID=UPI0033E095E8